MDEAAKTACQIDAMDFGFLLAEVARHWKIVFDREIGAGSSLTEGLVRTLFNVFWLGDARQITIAEQMGVEPMTISAYVNKLEGEGLVQRRRDHKDGRVRIVEATTGGERLLEQVAPLHLALSERLWEGFDEAGRNSIAAAFAKMKANLEAGRGREAGAAASPDSSDVSNSIAAAP
ncbi:MarR family winged helix-turn-helix transcriptional regulator [Consotaella salsifontis]|uniref:Transcriptional regulator, MarR family n=1 Tax=Consotaella salsifontis TaxID=1365950 RepID=A0A1T4SXC7_9HYPH|nr:MarR family winged helix-turn-helix transcriptional regulator [Consotaella salsifontis]SKA32789.1 transcriptional regulator, MarR family [Consotaella salsifontis]